MKTNQIKRVIFQQTLNVNILDIISRIFLTGAEIRGESGAGLQQLTLTCQTTSNYDTSDRSDQEVNFISNNRNPESEQRRLSCWFTIFLLTMSRL